MITVVGSANMDLVARVPRLPTMGETMLATDLCHLPGGKGANQAVAAARAGSEVVFVGKVGVDQHGAVLRQSMERAGVDLTQLLTDSTQPTGMALITVDDAGENSIVVIPGANGQISTVDIDAVAGTIQRSSVLLLQLEIPPAAVWRAVGIARACDVRILLNPSPVQSLDGTLLRDVDILVANEAEIAALSGVGFPVDPASAARLLLQTGLGAVVVTLGSQGVVIVTPGEELDIPAFAVDALDTTGAGDAFVGNLAHGINMGESLPAAARFATAAAALSVLREGAQPSMPSGLETQRLLDGEARP